MKSRRGIAFVHTGAWGDLYVSLASLKSAMDQNPGEEFFLIGSDKWLKIIDPASWPSVQAIISSSDGWQGQKYTWDPSKKQWQLVDAKLSLLTFYSQLKTVYNLRTESLRYAFAPLLARVPRRYGSAPLPSSLLFYTHRAPWLGKDPLIHERDRMLQVIEAPDRIGHLASAWTTSGGLPPIKSLDRDNANRLVKAGGRPYWLINPTSSRREKAWPVERFRELATKLKPELQAHGIELRLIGAPSETDWLRESLPESDSFAERVLQPNSYRDLFDVVGASQLLITNTSSLQFVSPGYGVKTLTLMGSARPEIWGPLGPGDILVQSNLAYTFRQNESDIFACDQRCYREISVTTVFDKCLSVLKSI